MVITEQDKITIRTKVANQLIESEGYVDEVYKDSLGKETIGIGFLVSSVLPGEWLVLGAPPNDKGDAPLMNFNCRDFTTTKEHSLKLLDIKLKIMLEHMLTKYPWTKEQSINTLCVLLDMTYNMGLGWFSKFKKTVAYVRAGDYDAASVEMLDSLWARQVGGRAIALSNQLKKSARESD